VFYDLALLSSCWIDADLPADTIKSFLPLVILLYYCMITG